MLLLIFALLLLGLILCIYLYVLKTQKKTSYYNDLDNIDGLLVILMITLGICSLVIVASIMEKMSAIPESKNIDRKIEMYEEENANIEKEIENVVANYLGHEEKIFELEKITAFFMSYPELKSNELVNKQINVYLSNNEEIKQLKTQKIEYSVDKWWLYFGN